MWIVHRRAAETDPWVQWGIEHPTCQAARAAYLADESDDGHEADPWEAVEIGVGTTTEPLPVEDENPDERA
jgi:hypothetical protein